MTDAMIIAEMIMAFFCSKFVQIKHPLRELLIICYIFAI